MWRDWQAQLNSILSWKIKIHKGHGMYVMNYSFLEKRINAHPWLWVVFEHLNPDAFFQCMINLSLRVAVRLSKCPHWVVRICSNLFAFIYGIFTFSSKRRR